MNIRSLTVADADAVITLESQIFASDAWSPQTIRAELVSQWSQYFGAFHGENTESGKLIGYVGIKGGVEGDLMTLAVDPDERGVGVGKKLLMLALERASRAGMRRMFLEVRESNVGAQTLYRQAGFVPLGTVKAYYRDPVEDAVTMRKDLLV